MLAAIISIVVALVGIGGIILGQRMARLSEQKKFLREIRKDEFQTLLAALTKAYGLIVQSHIPMNVMDGKDMKAQDDAEMNALAVIRDRVYIADDLKRLDILNRWMEATNDAARMGLQEGKFSKRYNEISADIVKVANESQK